SDKHYLKQYEDETSLTCYLLVDHSESMLYGDKGLNKLQYAQLIAFSLAYLVIEQRDFVALMTFSEAIDDWLPPSGSPVQFEDMVSLMERAVNHRKTNLPSVLEQAAQRLSRRGLVVLISDLLDDADAVLRSLRLLRLSGHDAMLIHVLDRDEVEFPFDTMSRFDGLEELPHLVTDPRLIAAAYRQAMADFCRQLEVGCRQIDIDYFRVLTDESLASSLPRLLAARSSASHGMRGY
ncbi:MAG: VWA domain-containing protein, partial [Aureliella sp.]